MLEIAKERPEDWWEVEALFDLAFAPGREALSSYRLRDGVDALADLSRVARDPEGILAGAVRFWPIRVGDNKALLLGPIAVHPTRQGEGLGGALIRESLSAAREAGWHRALLVGDAGGQTGVEIVEQRQVAIGAFVDLSLPATQLTGAVVLGTPEVAESDRGRVEGVEVDQRVDE